MLTKKEYDQFIEGLKNRGYLFCGGSHPYYYKVLLRRKDEDGDERSVCTISFYLYDFSEFINHRCFSYEAVVMISRTIEECIDINLCHPKRPIEECEKIALQFMDLVDGQLPLSCKEKQKKFT